MTLPRAPLSDATGVEIAVVAGRLEEAALREDIVQTLISAADLDRMARGLGPQHATAIRQASAVVARAITVLEQAVRRGEIAARRDGLLRAAYAAAPGDRPR